MQGVEHRWHNCAVARLYRVTPTKAFTGSWTEVKANNPKMT